VDLVGPPALFAVGALVTELALAVTFVVSTVLLPRPRGGAPRRVLLAGTVASLIAAGFALNLALLVGDAAPWALGDPFDSGVAVEYLLVGLGLVTALTAFMTIRVEEVGRRRCGYQPRARRSRMRTGTE
jgi:hypothetical protein